MLASLALTLLSATAALASPFTSEITLGERAPAPGVGAALWDGQCVYPAPQSGFQASKYVGTTSKPAVWYQLAASFQFFEIGCTCVQAQYGLLSNGSISVLNYCRRGSEDSTIKGIAPPTKAYGDGTFKVNFGFPTGSCPGPNYIVSKYYTNSAGAYTAALVGSAKFDGWFVLSKTRVVSNSTINGYLNDLAKLGYDLSKKYSITEQRANCPNP